MSTHRRRLTICLMLAIAPLTITYAAPAAAATEAVASTSAETKAAEAPAKQQFLAILRPAERLRVESAWTKADEEATGRHFRRLQEAAAAGTVIFAGRTQEPLDATMGLIVFEAADATAAKAWAEADPAVVAGVMTVEVRPYQLAVTRD